jgi:cell wall-associated NlpC family hydrolase
MMAEAHPLPGLPAFTQITLPDSTEPARIALVKLAIETASSRKLNRYIFGSADPALGGFDCSGAVFYLLEKRGIEAPRSSASQFNWIKATAARTATPSAAVSAPTTSGSRRSPPHPASSATAPRPAL